MKQGNWAWQGSDELHDKTFIYETILLLLPQSMCDQFLQLREFHKYNTRNALSDCITLPKPRTNYLKYSLAYHGAHYWNSVPLQLRRIDSCMNLSLNLRLTLLSGPRVIQLIF